MEISPQVREIISVLTSYARQNLRDPEMLAHFLQHAADDGKHAPIADLSFTGKYLARVQSALRRQAPGSELYDKLEQEFSHAVHSFHAKVKEFAASGDEEFRGMVERHCLAVSQQSLQHLVHLAEDFAWLKNWELEMTQDQGADPGPDGDDR